ncbi:MAG: nitroreductase family protein [Clostridium sp.]|nr:nitroreductase family protein [Clostridium sp.]
MELSDVIRQRRSIRAFAQRPVPHHLLLELVQAGALAPSASNLQAWQFFLLTDPQLVKKVDLFSPGLSGKPPVILAVCSDMDYALAHGSPNSEIYGCMMDAAMAAENILLKAVDLGLGACAVKSYNDTAVRKLLNLPSHYRIEILISLGYPEGSPRPRRVRPMEEILHYNQWEDRNESD